MTITPLDILVLRALQAASDAPVRVTRGDRHALVRHDPDGTVLVDGHGLPTTGEAAAYLRDALDPSAGYERVGTGTPSEIP